MSVEASADVRSSALRLLSNGVYVLTTCLDETIHAASITWVSQISFEPPLVLAALQKNSHLAHAVRNAHRFALNVLDASQRALAESFFEHVTVPTTSESLATHRFRYDAAHCPLLTDGLAWLECRLAGELRSPGDHCLMLGEVTAAGVRRPDRPMVLWDTPWSYGGLRAP